jgi:O-antigen/teichoic acid export membrane protein
MAPLYSALAKVADNKKLLEDKLFKCLSLSYIFIFPSVTGIIFLSTEIVTIVLGDQWLEAAPVLANLSFLMIVFITNGTFRNAFILKGLFKGIILIDILGLLLIIGALFWESVDNIAVFSQYRAIVGVVIIISTIFTVQFVLKFKLFPFVIALVIPTLCSLCMWFTLSYFASVAVVLADIYYYTVTMVIIGALSYMITLLIFVSLLKNKHAIWHFNHSFIISAYSNVREKINTHKTS